MIKREWKHIFHNAWIIIVLIAIILIPSIYATVFLGSMWDPYGNTESLPVAIVNEDQKVHYQGQTLDVGNDLVDNLKENNSLDFHFTDKQSAENGLKNGDYYMILTIPKDFSANATTLFDSQPKKMELQYTTNPETNYIATKISDTAVSKIKEEVADEVTKTYTKTIFEQLGTLSSGLQDAVNGTDELETGVKKLLDGNNVISSNLNTLANSTITFQSGSDTLTKGIREYTNAVSMLSDGVSALENGTKSMEAASPSLQDGITKLDQGADSLNQGISSYLQGAEQVSLGVKKLSENSDTLNKGTDQLSNGLSQLSNSHSQVVSGLESLQQSLSSGSSSLDQYMNVYTQLQQINTTLADVMKNNGITKTTLDELKQKGIIDETIYQAILSILPENGLPSFEEMLITMQKSLHSAESGVQTLTEGSKQIQSGIEQTAGTVQKQLQPGIQAYTEGVSAIQSGLQSLTDNNGSLQNGSSQLTEGIHDLSKQTPALLSGIHDLHNGATQLNQGATAILLNNDKLNSGSEQLTQGASQLSDGAKQLADGSLTLQSGLQSAKDGVSVLHSGLQDGAKQTQMKTNDDTYSMISSPVQVNNKEMSIVENNGHAMAPYMMSVALYVAGMAFVLMYPLRNYIKQAKNGFRYWLSKASVMYSISTIAAILLVASLQLFNNFHPQNLLMTYIFAIVVSAAFMSIICLLNLTTGFIGDFLLLVFMIINLGGSAGTYPIETANGLYNAIHAFVPYTYSVDGFRKTISLANPSLQNEILVFLGIFVVCSALTILYFQFKNKEDEHLVPQAFESQHTTEEA